jgi:phosphatidylserine/phosphatidylglycerophosphate/cardiolipin synthase-like enzyme
MDDAYQTLIRQLRSAAAELPPPVIDLLVDALRRLRPGETSWPPARTEILQAIPHPHYRSLAATLVDAWCSSGRQFGGDAVALALSTAAACEKARREEQTIEVVWTGPDTEAIPVRHTEQVLLQMIEAARERFMLVSYAVFKIPRICQALVEAADRGVALTIILETPELCEGEEAYSTIRALGDSVTARASVYIWPSAQRPRDASGRHGILHVKCAIADGRQLFLSSANLTEYALTLNMELGLLITGGPLAGQVETHFNRLIAHAILTQV